MDLCCPGQAVLCDWQWVCVVLCQTEQAEGCWTSQQWWVAIWGGKGGGIFFPCSVHSECRMILSCKAASLQRLQFCKSIRTSFNLVNQLSPFFLYIIIPYHEFFLCFALTGFIMFQAVGVSTSSLGKLLWGPVSFVVRSCVNIVLTFSFNFMLLALRHELMLVSIYGLNGPHLPEI